MFGEFEYERRVEFVCVVISVVSDVVVGEVGGVYVC